jgi:hypothetical protein
MKFKGKNGNDYTGSKGRKEIQLVNCWIDHYTGRFFILFSVSGDEFENRDHSG